MFSVRRVLREPLLHFLLLGAALFVAFSWTSGNTSTGPKSIVVTQGTIEHLVTRYTLTRQRPPTEQEIKGLVDDYIREEVSVREAMLLGLDRDDQIIRRRLRQKMEFVSEDLDLQSEPNEEELQAYLNAHPTEFTADARFTFRQVYLDPGRHGETLQHDADKLLATLKRNSGRTPGAAFGDPLPLESEFENAPSQEVKNTFGGKFAAILDTLPIGRWQGPVESAYGVHCVFLAGRTESRVPLLENVRDAVRREWANTKRLEANAKFYEELLKQYTVTIEHPEPGRNQEKLVGVK